MASMVDPTLSKVFETLGLSGERAEIILSRAYVNATFAGIPKQQLTGKSSRCFATAAASDDFRNFLVDDKASNAYSASIVQSSSEPSTDTVSTEPVRRKPKQATAVSSNTRKLNQAMAQIKEHMDMVSFNCECYFDSVGAQGLDKQDRRHLRAFHKGVLPGRSRRQRKKKAMPSPYTSSSPCSTSSEDKERRFEDRVHEKTTSRKATQSQDHSTGTSTSSADSERQLSRKSKKSPERTGTAREKMNGKQTAKGHKIKWRPSVTVAALDCQKNGHGSFIRGLETRKPGFPEDRREQPTTGTVIEQDDILRHLKKLLVALTQQIQTQTPSPRSQVAPSSTFKESTTRSTSIKLSPLMPESPLYRVGTQPNPPTESRRGPTTTKTEATTASSPTKNNLLSKKTKSYAPKGIKSLDEIIANWSQENLLNVVRTPDGQTHYIHRGSKPTFGSQKNKASDSELESSSENSVQSNTVLNIHRQPILNPPTKTDKNPVSTSSLWNPSSERPTLPMRSLKDIQESWSGEHTPPRQNQEQDAARQKQNVQTSQTSQIPSSTVLPSYETSWSVANRPVPREKPAEAHAIEVRLGPIAEQPRREDYETQNAALKEQKAHTNQAFPLPKYGTSWSVADHAVPHENPEELYAIEVRLGPIAEQPRREDTDAMSSEKRESNSNNVTNALISSGHRLDYSIEYVEAMPNKQVLSMNKDLSTGPHPHGYIDYSIMPQKDNKRRRSDSTNQDSSSSNAADFKKTLLREDTNSKHFTSTRRNAMTQYPPAECSKLSSDRNACHCFASSSRQETEQQPHLNGVWRHKDLMSNSSKNAAENEAIQQDELSSSGALFRDMSQEDSLLEGSTFSHEKDGHRRRPKSNTKVGRGDTAPLGVIRRLNTTDFSVANTSGFIKSAIARKNLISCLERTKTTACSRVSLESSYQKPGYPAIKVGCPSQRLEPTNYCIHSVWVPLERRKTKPATRNLASL